MTMTETMNVDLLLEMESVHVKPFTEHDKVILRSYEAVVDGIASLIGPFCEIVLHSLEISIHRRSRLPMVKTQAVKWDRQLPIWP